MEYRFREIEKKWREWWKEKKIYKVSNDSPRPKYYVLDMFPYPSGAGLHVGHPLGYIASDIYARYKRLKGFNVLHPMGYDAFGLPAEQYAIEHGIHPAVSTAANIKNFRSQLDKIGFSFDWDREVNTSKPEYYKWTQWIFLQLFNSFYNRKTNKAEPIENLIASFEKEGNTQHSIPNTQYSIQQFTSGDWKKFDESTQQDILMQYRLAYCGYGEVNWCEALGTVLANDEVVNGVSERGGHPVVKKKLRQWYLRITEYADRLLEGLNTVDFSESMKEMQSNWIGKSSGAEIDFVIRFGEAGKQGSSKTIFDDGRTQIVQVEIGIEEQVDAPLRVYTTRPDTIFGVDFMVIAPEHELVEEIKTPEQTKAVDEYIAYVKSRSERERMAEKKITGVFTGSYAINPFDGREIPIWISEYVLAGYGTGAIMAVPCGDERDHKFAKHFNIPITNIIGSHYNGEEANPTKDAILENSDFINGMLMKDAIEVVINKIEEMGIGLRKVNYKMRDAAFSRQRYWGEPFPIVWKGGIAYPLNEPELPVELPHMDELKPGEDAEGPLWNLKEWKNYKGGVREVNTMPGYAGSSWYFLRYMDPDNEKEFCSRKASDYWGQVDLYIGGTEHAVGHLLYSRMWTKCLYDLGLIGHDEPYKRLVNQGMITGKSFFVDGRQYVYEEESGYKKWFVAISSFQQQRNFPDVIVKDGLSWIRIEDKFEGGFRLRYAHQYLDAQGRLTKSAFDTYKQEQGNQSPIFEKDIYIDWSQEEKTETGEPFLSGVVIEKMSKSKFNVDNPDDLVAKYGADTFRMYEMFLGPVEMSKPWDTKGIEGVHRFLKKLWRLFFDEVKGKVWNDEKAADAELKVLHKTIKKIEEDTERFSFNTGVSTFMICVNELTDLKCHKKEILEPLLILLAPYAPHIAEELYAELGKAPSLSERAGGEVSILDATFPKWNEKYLKETSKAYPVAINGKTRHELTLALDATQQQVEEIVLKDAVVLKWLEGKPPKKIIYVKNKMINVVV